MHKIILNLLFFLLESFKGTEKQQKIRKALHRDGIPKVTLIHPRIKKLFIWLLIILCFLSIKKVFLLTSRIIELEKRVCSPIEEIKDK